MIDVDYYITSVSYCIRNEYGDSANISFTDCDWLRLMP